MKTFIIYGKTISVRQHFNGQTLLSIEVKSGRRKCYSAVLSHYNNINDYVKDYYYRLLF